MTSILALLGIGLYTAIVFCVGWFLFPAPRFVVNLWAALGLAKKVP